MSVLKYLKPAFLLVSKRKHTSRPMSTPHDNEEKGYPPAAGPGTDNGESSHSNEDPNADPNAPFHLIPGNDKLAGFRNLVGIQSHRDLADKNILNRPAKNLGIYGRVVASERHMKRDYKIWATLINSCLGLQIVVAAALTALGAAGGTNKAAVTAFGAINTVIAGFLTYLKGSGLPTRIKYYENEWTKLREYIEQRERDFGVEGCNLDLEREVRTIEGMFEVVMSDIETNTPDRYVNTSQIRRSTGVSPGPPIGGSPTGANRMIERPARNEKQAETEIVERRP